jgi:Tol biopolymer transport system component/DNA-binding winged helix-turn-helix (wHTH) protein
MLKSHKNLLEPRPSDRMRIGDRLVDIPLREIAPAAGGDAVRVTLKSLGVLLTLVAHANKLVSREALLEWVWPDTLPGDDVVTQAITQLRKALGDDREQPRYIETIAKQGYRLIAPVEWLMDEASATASAPAGMPVDAPVADAATPAKRARWPWGLGAALMLLTVVAVLAYWRGRDDAAVLAPVAATPAPVARVALQRIASSPQREESPSLSPDGSQIVYVLNRQDLQAGALALQTTSAVQPRLLTPLVDDRWDAFPAWSPNGREIAFIRATSNSCKLMLIPATGGVPRELGDCIDSSMPIGWFPDSKSLISSGRIGDGSKGAGSALYRMAIDDGRWRPIAYARIDEDIDVRPAVSPDGRWIAFQRNLSLGDVWRIPVAGGTPQRLTTLRTNFNGLAWTRDSREIVFSRYRSDGVVLGKLRIDTGVINEYRGDDGGMSAPTVAVNGDTVAFVIEEAQSQLRQLRVADGEQAYARAKILFPSSRSDLLPTVSPDGRQMVFVSDRDGETRLWWAELAQPDSLRPIAGLNPMPRFPVQWNADSTRALAIGDSPDGRKTAYEIEPRQGRVRRLDVPDQVPVHVAYHPDADRILVIAEREQGRLRLILYDRSVRPWRALAQIDDAVYGFVDATERRIVFIRTYNPEIWQADLDLSNVRRIDEVGLRARIRTLTAASDGVWILDVGEHCEWRWRRVSGARPAFSQCLGSGSYVPAGVSYDAASRQLFASTPNFSGLDIGLLPLSVFASAGEAPDRNATR